MKKKILSLCLALTLLLALPVCMPTAKALSAGEYTVRVGEAYATPGDSVSVDVSLDADGAAFSSMQGLIFYDTTRLKPFTDANGLPLLEAAEGFTVELLSDTFEEYTHAHALAFSLKTQSGEPVYPEGEETVFSIRFRVPDAAEIGDAFVRLLSYTDSRSSTFVSAGDGVHGSVTYIGGKVAVLPDGYAKEPKSGVYYPYKLTTDVEGVETVFHVDRPMIRFPGAVLQNGRTVVAWKLDGLYYEPGAFAFLSGDITLEAVTMEVPKIVHGAAIKITPKPNDTALRFRGVINRVDYDALSALFGEGSVSFGMIAAPQQNIDVAGACTYEAFERYVENGKQPYVCYPPRAEWAENENKGVFSNFYVTETESEYTLLGAIGNFHNGNLRSGVRFNASVCVKVLVNGFPVSVYSATDFTSARDVAYVVNCALNAYLTDRALYTDDQVKWLKRLKERCES